MFPFVRLCRSLKWAVFADYAVICCIWTGSLFASCSYRNVSEGYECRTRRSKVLEQEKISVINFVSSSCHLKVKRGGKCNEYMCHEEASFGNRILVRNSSAGQLLIYFWPVECPGFGGSRMFFLPLPASCSPAVFTLPRCCHITRPCCGVGTDHKIPRITKAEMY